ncbi:tetratricopeptide repeat protein [Polaromonas jejuensis]|uniref:Tetratricopeptide repeat protein n=1 Tax=Polaromonas jejuensis TaxID=457502 RepID=A0ABW0QEW6_9BURK|nr:SEL1-like repeat protein [Polaromonas jejuensis]
MTCSPARRQWTVWRSLACWTILAISAMSVNARVAAQPVQTFKLNPVYPTTIETSGPAAQAPLLPAGSVTAEPIQPSGSVGAEALRMPEPLDPALEAEVTRLRATAMRQAGRGSATERTAANASWMLGLLYLHGRGVAKDLAQAQMWFERARSLGEPLANAGLAWCEIDGCATAPNPAAARPWIAQLRQVDRPRADYLEWLMESRLAPLQIASPTLREPAPASLKNRDLLLRASNGGNVHARIELGLESVTANRQIEAMAYFRSVAARSEAAAANLALLASTTQTNPDTGARIRSGPLVASASAEQFLASARRYHRGEGVPANYVEAIRLYRLAEAKGSKEAHRMLALIASRPRPDGSIDVAWMQQLGQIDLSHEVPQVDGPSLTRTLHREPTALYDLLPARWRDKPRQIMR